MKTVDFHCHTKATKKHESELRTVTPELFAEMLDRAGVEIAAITNHNAFDLPQFQNLVSVTHDFAQIWPGVELDVQREGEHWHMLVICDPDKVEEFDSTLSSIVGDLKADEVLLDFETVWNAFCPLMRYLFRMFTKSRQYPKSRFKRYFLLLAINAGDSFLSQQTCYQWE